MSNSDIEQTGTVKGRISNVVSLSGHISIGSVAPDFIIKMTVEAGYEGNYTVASCDATVEQIDAAVAEEKRVVLIATDTANSAVFELPMLQGVQGVSYYFGTFLAGQVVYSLVQKVGGNTSEWQFIMTQIEAGAISYSNAALPNISTVDGALGALVPKSHTHANKDTLDKLSVAGGKLQYNGSDVGLKGDKGDKGDPGTNGYTPVKGTDYWTAADKAEIVDELKPSQVTSGTSITLADNTEYRLTDVTELTITYPNGNFECWMRLAFAASGNITVTLPADTKYIGTIPDFKNGETWELSIKDGVVVAGKVA